MTNLHWPSVIAAFVMTVAAQSIVYLKFSKDQRFLALSQRDRRRGLWLLHGVSAGLVVLMTAFGAWSAFLR